MLQILSQKSNNLSRRVLLRPNPSLLSLRSQTLPPFTTHTICNSSNSSFSKVTSGFIGPKNLLKAKTVSISTLNQFHHKFRPFSTSTFSSTYSSTFSTNTPTQASKDRSNINEILRGEGKIGIMMTEIWIKFVDEDDKLIHLQFFRTKTTKFESW